jgi:hypothetical protein
MTVFAGFCGIITHALDCEGVEASAGPAIVAAERFEDQQRALQSTTVFQCSVEGKIKGQSATGCHPVNDELARSANRFVVYLVNSDIRY